ncbi:MAG: penicillin-binding transpeptidase domain-containing protein [Streptosporangiaceae bacterium]
MEKRYVLGAGLTAVVLAAGGGFAYLHFQIEGTPESVAADYLAAWESGNFGAMSKLVDDPPADFAARHRDFSTALGVRTVAFTPEAVVHQSDRAASLRFSSNRTLEHGTWQYDSDLKIVLRDRKWSVDWSPATLLPQLAAGGKVRVREVQAPPSLALAADGRALPDTTGAREYLQDVTESFGVDPGEGNRAWAVEYGQGTKFKELKVFGKVGHSDVRTTLDRRLQTAADKAVGGRKAAIVAVRPSTGEILAVTDRLATGKGAFFGRYAPGSTFKVVTAAAAIEDGLSPGSPAQCPQTITLGVRTIPNHEGLSLGRTTLTEAFAQSCNTTFSGLAVNRLKSAKLQAAAVVFGFNRPVADGAQRASFPTPANDSELAEAGIGQGKVEATPLNMALVAAAVQNGTWRTPRMVAAKLLKRPTEAHPVRADVIAALRPMMRAVVTRGTAAGAGLPAGTYGKTGTAEYDAAGHSHAWFIGYRGDMAFAVLIPGGGSGPKAAVPLAARFQKAL